MSGSPACPTNFIIGGFSLDNMALNVNHIKRMLEDGEDLDDEQVKKENDMKIKEAEKKEGKESLNEERIR